jgi:hypothetical protein
MANPANPPDIESLYPAGAVPEVRLRKLSSLASLGMSPALMTGALVQILQQYFADARNVRNAKLRAIIEREGPWREANELNGIYIESIQNWRPELTQQRPAVIIKDGDWLFERMGIGNQMGESFSTGEQFYGGFWNGSHTVFAIGGPGAGGETKALGIEIAKALVHFAQLIANQLELHRFGLVKLGALASLKEAPEHYVMPIDVAYVSNENWSTQEEAPRLKRIEFRPSSMGL